MADNLPQLHRLHQALAARLGQAASPSPAA